MNPLKQKLDINNERYRIIVSVKEDYLDGKLSLEEGNRILKEKLGTCTPDEFAYAEQSLKGVYKDEEILDKMDDLLNLFDGVLVRAQNEYPENQDVYKRQEYNSSHIKEAEILIDFSFFFVGKICIFEGV